MIAEHNRSRMTRRKTERNIIAEGIPRCRQDPCCKKFVQINNFLQIVSDIAQTVKITHIR